MGHLISAAAVVDLGVDLEPGWVEIDEGMIVASGTGEPPRAPDEHHDGILAPGLIDAQINGAYGADFAAATSGDWDRIVDGLAATGVTAIAPTFITAPVEDLVEQLREFRRQRARLAGRPGATRLLGAHVEGPFISAACKGAHDEAFLSDPTPERVDALIEAGGPDLGYVTLAPERAGALEAIERLVAAGVRVSIGHSDADDTTASRAVDAGATLVTHLYNAQRGLRHRDGGVVGVALTDERLTPGLIGDLHHVDPIAMKVAFATAANRLMLVTDDLSTFGMPPGRYELGGAAVVIEQDQPARRDDGTIAGAAVRLDTCIANAVRHAGVDVATAVRAASTVPAFALGAPELGTLGTGTPADLVVLHPDELRVTHTWVGGCRVG
ncbi:N-acetylglucosamine-6-phosphate deacetylase [Aeromicrobium sp.]|uniref:N-acetylglucosamine-6-phosphate deacetylase n=1 Tax=Aeromicrobium sp. TaxID=1871063 RepID=UPI0028AAC572|nr:N-acetylglucosamine-6-phosphate deacetylase [Aeromicrobium sp.]